MVLRVLFMHYLQVHLGDNWTFVAELLKLTCNPKVSTENSPWSQSHAQCFLFLIGCCVCLCVGDREGWRRSISGCTSTAASLSVCCGNRAPAPSLPCGTTTARIWYIQTFVEGNKDAKNLVATDTVTHTEDTAKVQSSWCFLVQEPSRFLGAKSKLWCKSNQKTKNGIQKVNSCHASVLNRNQRGLGLDIL